jgi:hypothetical protein
LTVLVPEFGDKPAPEIAIAVPRFKCASCASSAFVSQYPVVGLPEYLLASTKKSASRPERSRLRAPCKLSVTFNKWYGAVEPGLFNSDSLRSSL